MTPIIVAIITMATITMLVTRPGVADAIRAIGSFMSAAMKALLGVDYE